MPKPRSNSDSTPPFNPAAFRAMMERTLRATASIDRSAEDRAQDLVYDAMEATSIRDRLRLASQALDLDPKNVDALLMMLEAADLNAADRIEELRKLVEIGADRLGKKAFEEIAPHFWGAVETRPYMRARQHLAVALFEAGRLDEAATEFAEMLALNENDNQAVRYRLLPLLLTQSRMEEARALLERFDAEMEWSAVLAWCRVLERHLSGDETAAVKALAAARKQNPHMETFLKGHRRLPKNRPAYYSLGSKEEAQCFADDLKPAWDAHPQALAWLSSQPHSAQKSD
jgi:tetratricopeptide (TPR) repeat protein